MLDHRRVTPSIKFAGTHLYTWMDRGTVRVKCPAHMADFSGPRWETELMNVFPQSQSRTDMSGSPLPLPTVRSGL